MLEIKSGKYICEVCSSENDITYNKGSIKIENNTYETRKCHSCGALYNYSSQTLNHMSKHINAKTNSTEQSHKTLKEDSAFSNFLITLLFGGIGLVVIMGLFMIIHVAVPEVAKLGVSAKSSVVRSVEGAPYLKYSDNKLYIDDFEYSFGVIEINKASGDFDKLNRKVFSLLKKHTGNCAVYIKIKSQDKYGNITEVYQRKGTINTNELRKYKNAELWAKSGVMQRILLR